MKFSTYKKNNIEEIIQVFGQTFTDSEGKEEGAVIQQLASDFLIKTSDTDLDVFIATDNEKIVAAVIFTTFSFEENETNACILSPMAVVTSHQKKGLGQQLINFAIEHLKQKGVALLITYGDINFYSKVGFAHITEAQVKAPFPLSYPEGWLGQSLVSDRIEPISSKTTCVEALNNPEVW